MGIFRLFLKLYERFSYEIYEVPPVYRTYNRSIHYATFETLLPAYTRMTYPTKTYTVIIEKDKYFPLFSSNNRIFINLKYERHVEYINFLFFYFSFDYFVEY